MLVERASRGAGWQALPMASAATCPEQRAAGWTA